MGAWNLADPHLGIADGDRVETLRQQILGLLQGPDKSSAHNRDIQRDSSYAIKQLGSDRCRQDFKRIYRRILQLIGDSILRAAIQEEGSLDGIEMDGMRMAQRVQMRGYDSTGATVFQVVHRIFVAREAVEQIEVDDGEFARGKNLLDHRLAIFRIAGKQIDYLSVRGNCMVEVFNVAHGRNDGGFSEERP